MENEKNYIYLKLEGGSLGNKAVIVAVPEKDLDRSINVFKDRCETITQLSKDEIESMDFDEVKSIDLSPRRLPELNMPVFYNDKHIYYDNPKCQRCSNKYRLTDFCRKHSADTENCYRFKLEK